MEGTTLKVGDSCLFSSDIYITTTDSHSIIDFRTGQRINPSRSVTLGNHIWVGYKVTILKGVNIADDTIVGACSLVTRDIAESNVAVAGNPARIVRKGIKWDISRFDISTI